METQIVGAIGALMTLACIALLLVGPVISKKGRAIAKLRARLALVEDCIAHRGDELGEVALAERLRREIETLKAR